MVAAPESQFKTVGDRAEQAEQLRDVDDDAPAPAQGAQLNDGEDHRASEVRSLV